MSDGRDEIIPIIDHAVLAPDCTRGDVVEACELGAEVGVAGVCVLPRWVELAADVLEGTAVRPGTVVGFPLGASTSNVKAFEARQAASHGADEIDMVLAVTALKSGDTTAVLDDVAAVVGGVYVASAETPVVKVILECCYLTDDEKRTAVELAVEAGADFVKTSTGFGPEGATVEDVRLLRQVAPDEVGVKAAGGIRTVADARAMIEAGASRIGTSSTRSMAQELGVL
ncbi:MAG: deoxyribose-phosphate aldolase [Armatimonadota bacterium]|nr:deoxyribose-phosphate aldolase [Armatimonadota bacterium]